LAALARVMDPTEDILFVYLTSHGSEDHTLLVDLFPLPLDQIGADDLAGILDAEPFRWRVVVVNACYAGGFLPPLAGDGTLAISAARADRSSFGCGSEADITWFGDAFLAHALNTQSDFVAAFDAARTQIAAWEKRDDLPASEPQIAVGNGITSQLARWRAGFAPGPTLPFKPEPATP
ncbi:MAG TPA: C13 family peptidase, partial [Rhodanobacteraceae bacterium]|nr:C13 family peptidase [Rhodanobacteraceae bacterium]